MLYIACRNCLYIRGRRSLQKKLFRVMPIRTGTDADTNCPGYICADHYYNVGGAPGPGDDRISVTDQKIGAPRPTIPCDRILAPATSYESVLVISSNNAVRLTLFASGHGCSRLPVGR